MEELTGIHASEVTSAACPVAKGCCGAVKQFPFAAAASPNGASFQHWRWEIDATHGGQISRFFLRLFYDLQLCRDFSMNLS